MGHTSRSSNAGTEETGQTLCSSREVKDADSHEAHRNLQGEGVQGGVGGVPAALPLPSRFRSSAAKGMRWPSDSARPPQLPAAPPR